VTTPSSGPEVAIIRTGVANLASVVAAFERLGARSTITSDPALVASASHVMLPGVGAFGAGMLALRGSALVEPLRERIAGDRPTIAICLGLQLLCAASAETPGIAGLGVLPLEVGRFAGKGLKVPQLGWNRVGADPEARLVQSGYAYFANSFRLAEPPAGWHVATADYGGAFVAAIERGKILACQFHPELSGPWGQALLSRFLSC
jgi:imidazole glycerol phosphate synthase glutamine amidotransferase subunit